jgi:hypothetical protein
MHQTARDFLLGAIPGESFFHMSKEQARNMLGITCARYLLLICEEIRTEPKLSASTDEWSSEDLIFAAHYLDTRPFIQYSLKYFIRGKRDDQNPPDPTPLTELKVRLDHETPLTSCLLRKLATDSLDDTTQQFLNHLLLAAVNEGCTAAVDNVLAAGADAHDTTTPRCKQRA